MCDEYDCPIVVVDLQQSVSQRKSIITVVLIVSPEWPERFSAICCINIKQ